MCARVSFNFDFDGGGDDFYCLLASTPTPSPNPPSLFFWGGGVGGWRTKVVLFFLPLYCPFSFLLSFLLPLLLLLFLLPLSLPVLFPITTLHTEGFIFAFLCVRIPIIVHSRFAGYHIVVICLWSDVKR